MFVDFSVSAQPLTCDIISVEELTTASGCFEDSESPAVSVTLNVPFQNDLMKTVSNNEIRNGIPSQLLNENRPSA